MAGTFNTRRVNQTSAQAYTLRVQTSVQGTPRPIVYGQARLAGNLINFAGFTWQPVNRRGGGGKGGGSGSSFGKGSIAGVSIEYKVSVIIGIGEQYAQVKAIYNGSSVNFLVAPPPAIMTFLYSLGVVPTFGNGVYFADCHSGWSGETPDGAWNVLFGTGNALAYRGTGTVVICNLNLGQSTAVPNFSFEVLGVINSDVPELGPDANPADVIEDLLTNADHGVPGFPADAIGDFNTARNYWRAAGLLISPVITSSVSAQSILADFAKALNCDFRWSSGKLDIVPYADQPVGISYSVPSSGPSAPPPKATFIGSLAGNILRVTQLLSGTIAPGLQLSGLSITTAPIVLAQISGVLGGQGTYSVFPSGLAGPETMTVADPVVNPASADGHSTGYSFVPDLTPVYALTVDEFIPGRDEGAVVACQRKSLNTVVNKVQIEYLNRDNLYNPVTIYASDDAWIVATGRLRMSDLRQNHFFCLASAASQSAALQLARETMEINTYKFTLGRSFILLDPMDLVTLTEPSLDLEGQLVRIIEIEENEDQTLTMTAIDAPGIAGAPIYVRQDSLGLLGGLNTPAPDVNPPIFYEPPDQIGGGLVLWIGLSGQVHAQFGGCDVYISSDDETYACIGTFQGQSRMGTLTSAITSVTAASSGVTIDNTNAPTVDLSESGGELLSGSTVDLNAFNTAFVVDDEILAYKTASLTTRVNAYTLSTLARGGYGSTIAAHARGASFLRLDGDMFKWMFDASRVGHTFYFKFVSFNPFGGGAQNIASVGAYPYTLTGKALSSPLPNVTGLYANFEAGFEKIYWDEIKDFRSGVVYEIRKGSSWLSGIPIRTQAHPPFIADGNGTYWIAAKCIPIAGMIVYSAVPASITVAGNQLSQNLVFSYDEKENGWPGTLDSGLIIVGGGTIAYLEVGPAGSVTTGTPLYYTSAQVIDVGYVAQASLNATSLIIGAPVGQDILTVPNILADPDVLGSASTALVAGWVEINVGQPALDIFSPDDVFAVSDIFTGVVSWAGWQKFVPGVQLGRYFRWRLALESFDASTFAIAITFNYQVQVPARIDHYQNLTVTSGGLAITFQPDNATKPAAFNGGPNGATLPYVNVSWPNQAGDTYVISAFTAAGLTITFSNGGSPVTRTGVNVDVEGF